MNVSEICHEHDYDMYMTSMKEEARCVLRFHETRSLSQINAIADKNVGEFPDVKCIKNWFENILRHCQRAYGKKLSKQF